MAPIVRREASTRLALARDAALRAKAVPNVAEFSGSGHQVRQWTSRASIPGPSLEVREGFHVLVALLLASIVFLSTVLIVAALMMRDQWEKLGGTSPDGSTRRK